MIQEKLKKIMAETFGVSAEKIGEDSSIGNVETWDSLSHLKLVVAIEEGFNVKIGENDIINMRSFSDILNLLKRKGLA